PLAYTFAEEGGRELARSDFGRRLAPVLQCAQRAAGQLLPIYYLGCIPCGGEKRLAELALAFTSLGWPSGQLLLMPAEWAGTGEAMRLALDRLRWLFAGTLALRLLNLEPEAVPALRRIEPLDDRAEVRRLVQPADDPWTLCDEPERQRIRPFANGLRPLRA